VIETERLEVPGDEVELGWLKPGRLHSLET
jgi:hypothetical protein